MQTSARVSSGSDATEGETTAAAAGSTACTVDLFKRRREKRCNLRACCQHLGKSLSEMAYDDARGGLGGGKWVPFTGGGVESSTGLNASTAGPLMTRPR